MLLCVTEKRREASHRLNFLPILPVQDTLCQLSHLKSHLKSHLGGQKKMRMKAGGHLDLGGGGQNKVDRGGDGQETGYH